MANYDTNVFEKYGIKEVADVTFYRIDKKKEKYEAHRKITPASILQGELEKTTVYPFELQDDGTYAGGEEGYEAYIFPDADIIKGINYECDDGTYFVKLPGNAEVTITYTATPDETISATDTYASITGTTTGRGRRLGANPVKLGAGTVDAGIQTEGFSRSGGVAISGSKIKEAVAKGEDTTTTYTVFFVKEADKLNYSILTADGVKEGSKWSKVTISVTVGKVKQIGSGTYLKAPVGATTYKDEKASVIKDATTKIAVNNLIKNTYPDYEPIYDTDQLTNGILKGSYNIDLSKVGAEGSTDSSYPIFDNGLVFVLKVDPTDDSINATKVEVTPSTNGGRDDGAGTHEYTYAEQITMLFAKNQNLIDKRGVRYVFEKANEMFGDIDFDSKTAAVAPGSQEPVVIVGLVGNLDEINYDIDEVKDTIKALTEEYEAKAYDVEYDDYCELLVEDEMGFFDPQFLGDFVQKNQSVRRVHSFTDSADYESFAAAGKGIDFAISQATTWANGEHESINDAIDALRAKKLVIDTGEDNGISGIDRIHGGYKVTGWDKEDTRKNYPIPGRSDVHYAANVRANGDFSAGEYGVTVDKDNGINYDDEDYTFGLVDATGKTIGTKENGLKYAPYRSNYALEKVIEALSKLATKEAIEDYRNAAGEVEVKVTPESDDNGERVSNRAIYVNVDGAVTTATGSFIYLLHNINYKKLKTDRDGVFKFVDKKGNTLYYQDHIFAGTEYLALVIIGTKGLIFTVGRHGKKNFKNIAWMVSNNGFVTNKQAETLVKAGLIHTIPHTEEGETFDATCTVADMQIRKIEKESKHYTPVLFLDTLKTSTIECAAETTYATGGNGNANLIGWDYGKEITLTLEDALYSPASMNMMWGKADEDGGIVGGVKDVHKLDRFEKIKAKRNFIIPSGNQEGTPSEADSSVQTVYYDPATMEPFQDGTPIAEGEVIYKWTRTIAYDDNSLGRQIEVSSDGFPGTYRIVGETYARMREGGKDQRFQFEICEAKIGADGMSITLEADGDPAVKANCHNANAAVKCA